MTVGMMAETIFSFILIMMGNLFFAFGLGKAQYELGELERLKKNPLFCHKTLCCIR